MKFEPTLQQKVMIPWILDKRICAVWAYMGAGKTSAILYTLSALKMLEGGTTLVIAPLYVAKHTWPEDVKKFDDFSDLTVSTIVGSVKDRTNALKKKADIYCINFENLPWLANNKPEWLNFDRFVIDESTKVKSFRLRKGSKRAKALFMMLSNANFIVELTGTPAANGLIDLWGQIYLLDHGTRLGRTLSAFRERWFKCSTFGGSQYAAYTPYNHSATEIGNRLSDICLSIRAEDYEDVDEVCRHKVDVTLPPVIFSQYRKFHKEMILELQSGCEIRAFNAPSKTLKCLQMASGAIYTGEGDSGYETFHDEKLNALESIIEEAAGESILLAYHFKHDISRIKARFPQAVHFKDDKNVINIWNKGKIPILIAHPASIGHGLNLQDGGRIVVFFSHWWSFEEKAQFIERIGPVRQKRSGHPRVVHQYDIIAKKTIDEDVISAQQNKLGIDAAIRQLTKGVSV